MATRLETQGEALTDTAGLPSITSFTMMAWVLLDGDENASGAILGYGAGGGSAHYSLGVNNTGTRMALWNSGNSALGTVLSLNTWYHFALTVAGTGTDEALGYLDGTLDITHDGSATPTATTLTYGSPTADWGTFNGRVAALKVWDAVLTANEIRAEMHQYVPKRWANLNRFVPSWAGDRTRDYSRNGNDFSETGTLSGVSGPPIAWDWGIPLVAGTAAGGGGGGGLSGIAVRQHIMRTIYA